MRMVCSMPNCTAFREGRGLCGKHYKRLMIHGDPNIVLDPWVKPRRPFNDRFTEKIWVLEDTCWLWTGTIAHTGYGQIGDRGQSLLAHRVSYQMFKGPIPDGLQIDHLCRNRWCVNPDHMEPVTLVINVERGVSPSALNRQKTHCPAGHPYDHRFGARQTRGCRPCINARRRAKRAIEGKQAAYFARLRAKRVAA